MTRRISRSPVLMARLSQEILLKRFFPPLLDSSRQEAGRICSANTRLRA
jgi:hypothetical protein